jgi:dihydrofolate reductase (trimethoprim resistance protein)
MSERKPQGWEWPMGTRVRKIEGASWQGPVVGFYSTKLTPEGYAVESEREPGNVQNFPRAALAIVEDDGHE